MGPPAEGIAERICSHRGTRPERVAVTFEGVDVTWRGLVDVIERLAGQLASAPGPSVALLLPNSLAFVVFFLAGVRAGKNVQVLDPEWSASATRQVIDELQPGCLIASAAASAPAHQNTISLPDPYLGEHEIVAHAGTAGEPQSLPPTDVTTPFYTGFTSGSTGLPKGFVRDQRSWLESFRSDAVEFGFSDEDVFVAPGSLVHSLFLYAVVRGLYAGGRVALFRRFRPDRVWQTLVDSRATILYAVPVQYDALTAFAEPRARRATSVRLVLSSGAKLPGRQSPGLRSIFPEATIGEFYGASELSYVTVAREGEAPPDSVGRAFHGVDIRIRNPAGDALPPGETGAIFVSSPLAFLDYAFGERRPPKRIGNALCIGDVGYLDENGFLFLVGRVDRMIVSSGLNVYPEEVESVLGAHPAVTRAVVFGRDDSRRGQRLSAVIEREPSQPATRRDLITWCRQHLPLGKVPMEYSQLADWPFTVSDKIDLVRLRMMLEQGAMEPFT